MSNILEFRLFEHALIFNTNSLTQKTEINDVERRSTDVDAW